MSKHTRSPSATSDTLSISALTFPTKNPNKDIRKPLKEPIRPIGLRYEYMAEQKTQLTLYPAGSAFSECAYSIEYEDGVVLFTVSGRRSSPHCCREVRDQTGLPLFEIHQGSRWIRNEWSVTLPGGRTNPIAIGRRSHGGDLHLEMKNLIEIDCNKKDHNLPIELESHGRVLKIYDVVDGNRRIMEIKESVRHNKKLALLSTRQAGYRPAMDMMIMPGVDMAMAVAIAVVISASSFPANKSC